jgi:hypothetical protein
MSCDLRRRPSPRRIALDTYHSTLLIKMISMSPAGLSLSDLGMFLLDVLFNLHQAAPFVESQCNAGLCRFDSAVLCHVVFSDVDASVSGDHRHVPRCADVQAQLDFFFSDQLVDRIINLVKELDELRPAWTAERRHLVRSVFEQTDLVILYYNKTLLTDFKRHFCSVIVECDCYNPLNTYCSVLRYKFPTTVLLYPALYYVSSSTFVLFTRPLCCRRQQPHHCSVYQRYISLAPHPPRPFAFASRPANLIASA